MSGSIQPILGGTEAAIGAGMALMGMPEGLSMVPSGIKTATSPETGGLMGSVANLLGQGTSMAGGGDTAGQAQDASAMAASVGDPTAGAMDYAAQKGVPAQSPEQDINQIAQDIQQPANVGAKVLQQQQPVQRPAPQQVGAAPQPQVPPQSVGRAGAAPTPAPNPLGVLQEYHAFLNSMAQPNTNPGPVKPEPNPVM